MEAPETQAPEAPKSREDARIREHLANERTLLSWVRLGLASAGFGFIVARFGLFLREIAHLEGTEPPDRLAEFAGVALVLLGPLLVLLAARRYFRTEREIEERAYTSRYGLVWSLVIGSVALGLALAAYLIFTRPG